MAKETIRYQSLMADSARWENFPFREDDIIISTPPKCGTTWVQMICALLVFQTPNFDRPLDEISPWFDVLTADRGEFLAALEAQSHRRFIKTHTPLDGLPLNDHVIYVCIARDPRDVGVSLYHHMTNLNLKALITARQKANPDHLLLDGQLSVPAETDEIEWFWQWVDGPGLAGLFHHVRTFWAATAGVPNLVLLHYDNLQTDLEREMRYLARRLNIHVPEQRWPELVSAARFDEMRRRADDLVPDHGSFWHDKARFFHRGKSGQWRAILNEDDLRRYHLRVAELGDPELAAWLHKDPMAD